MKIALLSPEQATLTGQPMYTKRLALGLSVLGHDVLMYDLKTINDIDDEFDLAIINDHAPEFLDKIKAKKIYNFCHSMNDCDKPIEDERIDGYLYPRPEVEKHWGIWGKIMPIPIIPDKESVIMAGTFDKQREPMINDLIERCRKGEIELTLVGRDCGAKFEIPEYVNVLNEMPHNELKKLTKQHDTVAGLHIGTTTLEAWFMGKKTIIYDLDGNWEYVKPYKDFEKKHNYLEVAKLFTKL